MAAESTESNIRRERAAVNSYREAEEYILSIPKFTSKNCMEHTKRFLRHIGSPSSDKKIIHVAGTNGKGSVCAYLCSVMKEAGIRCGMFTSPHLVTMRERFVIDGEMISEEMFLQAFRKVEEGLATLPDELKEASYHPTFFEYLFFMAMFVFEEQQVEYLVLETGLGGRLDATNALEHKEICVITSIGYDHMEYLGETLAEIAAEKAGIVRKDTPVIYWDKNPEVTAAIERCARLAGADCIPLQSLAIKEINIQNKTIDFSFHFNYYGYIRFTVSTSAYYQVENASLAIKTLECLADERILTAHMQDGIRKMRWAGRMEEILPSVYLDGAHNIDGILAFLETVRKHPANGERKLIYSVVKDKQYQAAIESLASSGLFSVVGVVELNSPRALPLGILKDTFGQYTGLECRAYNTLEEALDELVFSDSGRGTVYIVGSLYLAGEVKAVLGRSLDDKF